MTGWRIGFVVGNPLIVKAYADMKDNSDSGQFLAIQKAGAAALANPQITEEIAANTRAAWTCWSMRSTRTASPQRSHRAASSSMSPLPSPQPSTASKNHRVRLRRGLQPMADHQRADQHNTLRKKTFRNSFLKMQKGKAPTSCGSDVPTAVCHPAALPAVNPDKSLYIATSPISSQKRMPIFKPFFSILFRH